MLQVLDGGEALGRVAPAGVQRADPDGLDSRRRSAAFENVVSGQNPCCDRIEP